MHLYYTAEEEEKKDEIFKTFSQYHPDRRQYRHTGLAGGQLGGRADA